MANTAQKHSSLFQKILDPMSGAHDLRIEKARLEAFLAAVPGEYCGFSRDGSVIFSAGFAGFLKLNKIESVEDIQGALSMSDAAALEGQFYDLQTKGKAFSIPVSADDEERIFRLSGGRGNALDGKDSFEILWLEDITDHESQKKQIEKHRDAAESETKRLQTAMDALPQLMWIRDAKHEITWCNRAYADALGITPATVIAEQKEIAVTKGKGPKAKELAQKALAEGAPQAAQVHAIMNGKRRFISISETPLPASDQTLGAAQDITREEELEQEIKRYTSANKELLEQLRSAIGICNPDHHLEFYNSAFAQLWGLEDHWLNTRPKLGDILEKLRESRRLPEQADFRKYKEGWLKMFTGLIDPHEDMLYLPDGKALRMLIIPNPTGGLILTFEDVTSSLELESSYNTLIAVQKETLDNLAEGVAVYGGDGRLKLWNPPYANLWNLNPEDLDGEPHTTSIAEKKKSLFADDMQEEQKQYLMTLALERKIRDGRFELADGRLVKYSTVPLPDGGVLISYYDVTDTVRVENALREKNAALEAAEQVKLDFLANVSYQLRTPLNALMGFNEILDNEYFGELSEKQKEYTVGIHEAGERLMNLINDILDLSTLEAGYMELDYEEFDIKSMLEGLQDLTDDWARTQNTEVILECPKTIGKLEADQRRIKQVVLNLIRNAIHFTPDGGTITLKAKTQKGNIVISVSDTGAGIPSEAQEKIFQPFERLQDDESNLGGQSRGAGLGLALVRNIVKLHGGDVTIDSEEGVGTTVSISLPTKAAH
ncbi:MAG: ATP-binding protein [Pseudomonadota bacterium]